MLFHFCLQKTEIPLKYVQFSQFFNRNKWIFRERKMLIFFKMKPRYRSGGCHRPNSVRGRDSFFGFEVKLARENILAMPLPRTENPENANAHFLQSIVMKRNIARRLLYLPLIFSPAFKNHVWNKIHLHQIRFIGERIKFRPRIKDSNQENFYTIMKRI